MAVGSSQITGQLDQESEYWDGANWAIETVPVALGATETLNAVSCTAADACAAVGDSLGPTHPSVDAYVWNGAAWTLQDVPNSPGPALASLKGISCTSNNVCTAVGVNEGAHPMAVGSS
jgi:hypothetical protein